MWEYIDVPTGVTYNVPALYRLMHARTVIKFSHKNQHHLIGLQICVHMYPFDGFLQWATSA